MYASSIDSAEIACQTPAHCRCFLTTRSDSGGVMEPKKVALLKYLGSFALLVTTSLAAQIFTDWTPPVNLGTIVNSAAADQ
jgi:hypothetical protein